MDPVNASIQVLGGAHTVTGSKHLLTLNGLRVLLDCGLFQGIKSLRLKNREPLPVDPKTIDFLLLSHAHLDHCGYIPLLVKEGFKGRIIMTPPTRDLATLILKDCAKIQEEDAANANRHGYSKHSPALPLYTAQDVDKALPMFETVKDEEWMFLNDKVSFRFVQNGHILGSCFIDIKNDSQRIVFSGDIGRSVSDLMKPPKILLEADILIMESTYGDRLHEAMPSSDELAKVVNDTIHQHGVLLIPSFAVGRAQELMLLINELKAALQIPNVPVYLDSPMAADASFILRRYPSWHKLPDASCDSVFKDIHIVREFSETRKVIESKGSKIVIAASGMLSGGRVLEYLKALAGYRENTILLTGYQAAGTRGRALKEGAKEVKMHGRYIPVKASVREIASLSAHADQGEMLTWLKAFEKPPKTILLVHGEAHGLEAFRVKIIDELKCKVLIPEQNQVLELK